jgi:hypothetical protein
VSDDGHVEYERIVVPMLRALCRMRGRKMTELAMVCYQGHASVKFDDREFERRHKAVDAWEAAILKAVADFLMVRGGGGDGARGHREGAPRLLTGFGESRDVRKVGSNKSR